MLFNSLEFLVFFPVVVALFFALPHRFRWQLLAVASYVFYGWWDWRFLGLLLLSTVVDYCAALGIEAAGDDRRRRRIWLVVTVTSNLGLLGFFKYSAFVAENVEALFGAGRVELPDFVRQIVLPVGISFYTFQTLSYTIDVYRGHIRAERHFGRFLVFVSFFPQLVAGPIERASNLLPQFSIVQRFDYARAREGLVLMGWGLFKKIVIADRLAVYVDTVYGDPGTYPGLAMVVATYFFAIQVYCDFSGYSDIAVGTARVMGFELMENFRRPYFAATFREFWERWHISLTTWFRDYLFIPLGGSRCSRLRANVNLFAVFTICGLWHGASWNCVIWGALNGVYLVVGNLTAAVRERWAQALGWARLPRLRRVVSVLTTFHLFMFSLMIYRSGAPPTEPLPEGARAAGTFERLAFNLRQVVTVDDRFFAVAAPMNAWELDLALVALACLFVLELFQERKDSSLLPELERRPAWQRWPVYYAAVLVILVFGEFSLQPFVYFRF